MEMLAYGDTIDEMAEPLKAAGLCLAVATRGTAIVGKAWADQSPLPVAIVYLSAAPAAMPPCKIAVPKWVRRG
ncbi:MAG: hypothetical protein DI601_06385 [Azospirillum brasilense]|nr:MAG: hypothetical protein DI601_06385 [Azospirillum brasilense]